LVFCTKKKSDSPSSVGEQNHFKNQGEKRGVLTAIVGTQS